MWKTINVHVILQRISVTIPLFTYCNFYLFDLVLIFFSLRLITFPFIRFFHTFTMSVALIRIGRGEKYFVVINEPRLCTISTVDVSLYQNVKDGPLKM